MVYRGDKAGKDRFTNRQGVFHASEKAVAEGYSSGGLYDLFLDIKNPLALDEKSFTEARERINDMLCDFQEMDRSELENNEQFQRLRENYLERQSPEELERIGRRCSGPCTKLCQTPSSLLRKTKAIKRRCCYISNRLPKGIPAASKRLIR